MATEEQTPGTSAPARAVQDAQRAATNAARPSTPAPTAPRWELQRCPRCRSEFTLPRIYRRSGKIVFDFSLCYCPLCDRTFHTDIPAPAEVARER